MEVEGAQDWCLEEKVEGWQASAAIMAGVLGKQPKNSYAGLQKSLQKEWDFVQCIKPDIGTAL